MLTRKFTLALNEKVGPDVLKKAAVLSAARLIGSAREGEIQEMRFLTFEDAAGSKHEGISALSLVVMKGKSGEIRKFRELVATAGISSSAVTRSDMLKVDGVNSASIPIEQELVAVMAFGDIPVLNAAAKKLSL